MLGDVVHTGIPTLVTDALNEQSGLPEVSRPEPWCVLGDKVQTGTQTAVTDPLKKL